MSYLETVKKLRSKREFKQEFVEMNLLEQAIEHVRYAAAARNNQVLRYALVNNKDVNQQIFELSNLKSQHKIPNHQQPMAYIILGSNEKMGNNPLFNIDTGIATQIIREALAEIGLASVPVFTFDRDKTKEILNNNSFYPELLIAIGYSNQVVSVVDSNEEVGYYRDDNNVHTIRKLKKEALIIK